MGLSVLLFEPVRFFVKVSCDQQGEHNKGGYDKATKAETDYT